jgi:DNA polymerase elongation subunit (family B)
MKLRYMVLDLETLPITSAADYVSVADISAPSNYKDAEKIAAYCAAKRTERIAEAALDLDLARICAIGTLEHGSPDGPLCVKAEDEAAEARELQWVQIDLDRADPLTLVTFNGHRYDLPLLMRRARYLGVPFPRISLDRYKSPHVDLYEELTMRGAIKAHGLRWYMRRHGWTDLLEADPLKDGGADVAQAAAEGRWKDIEAHVRCDVVGTYRLAQWLGVIPTKPIAECGF